MDMANPFPSLPERIRGLERLAYNLWWSWHPPARMMFRALDLQTWRESGHNPVRMLALLPPAVLENAARDDVFLKRYDAVMERFQTEAVSTAGWFASRYDPPASPLAYLSAEFGLHVSLPVYAGGLGILAGDHLKECSDLAIPVVGVGLIYSRGYVWQRIREDGWPEEVEKDLDRTYDPIRRVLDGDGNPLTVQVPLFDPPVYVALWRADVGRVPLYLLDTDLEMNQPWDRAITHHLYAADLEQRLRQEIVLGMGGIRALEALGIRPAALHINEGHPAFAILERIRHLVADGVQWQEAVEKVQGSTIFTTHTPLAAGTDVYAFQLIQKYFARYCEQLGFDYTALLQWGVHPENAGAGFNMTVFALRMARYCNAVSRRHGEVARKMWSSLWPGKQEADVPIAAITNGVHLPTWIEALELQPVLDRYLGADWRDDQDRPERWSRVDEIPDAELWQIHQAAKVALVDQINQRARARWQQDKVAAGNVIAFGTLLDPEVLTLGFARRFTDYKRPDLILADLERLKRLLNDPWHPLQIVFAGKAHPADLDGKRLIQKIFRLAQDPEFGGRIAFVENYDQQLATYLVHGVDVWLNNPLPPLEASGTSGMKASVNGTPHLSILDGWWIEGYSGTNGWAFGDQVLEGNRTPADSKAIYQILESEIIPSYYQRSDEQVPQDFVRVMKSAIKSVAPAFSARRMTKMYVEQFYVRALDLAEKDG
jgi:starch phosphorylase